MPGEGPRYPAWDPSKVVELFLAPHPAMPPVAVQFVNVQVRPLINGLQLLYVVEGDPALLQLPPPQEPGRAEDLWQTTCFELFLGDRDGTYREFNFSPSGQWAAYGFQGYRDGRKPLALADAPSVRIFEPEPFLQMLLATVVVDLEPTVTFGPTAVIEERDGTKSYWALAHPSDEPDFHHPDCFALELPAPDEV